ncbi:MAG: TRAP transporter small permease [Deltaproteobacteria bacterium]|nr:TRAP transporter small permease [Deltaproteobacteria bacterium]MBW2445651.1 TRAP transporter small permease [Deltaproteobacteria bacterium]
MILLAPVQILLRGALGSGIAWVDPLLRVLVLWVGLLGAVAASFEGRHITIDVLSRALPERARAAAGAVTSLFTAAVTTLLAYHGARFVASEFHYDSVAFSGIPAWGLESVIPLSFGLIALRYLRLAVSDLLALFRSDDADEGTSAGVGSS